jgi:hypothetical protein
MGQIHDTEFDDYLIDCVTIDRDAITDEYVRVAADLAYWSKKHADAELDMLVAKAKVKEIESTAYLQARELLENDPSVKRATESMVDATANRMPAVTRAREEYAETSARRKELEGVVMAISSKREMLISLGATLRKEMDGEPSMR